MIGRKFPRHLNEEWIKRLETTIPGGAHTFSRGVDQYPKNAPGILVKGKGAYVWGPDNRKYLDLGMALRSCILGYANNQVDRAAIRQIRNGNNLSKPSLIELEVAEYILGLFPQFQMVKFAKHGSSVTSAACRVARAYTNKTYICVPFEQPFFAVDDWFIGTSEVNRGIPMEHSSRTLKFNYNNIESLKKLFEAYPGEIAAVMMEPATHLLPTSCKCLLDLNGEVSGLVCKECKSNNFLVQAQKLCRQNGALLILDEMRTGFRWDLRGAQYLYGIEPDLATFGKAIANGYSVSVLLGKRAVMEVAAINKPGAQRTFLLSSTHGAEMGPLGAARKTMQIIEDETVTNYVWGLSRFLQKELEEQLNLKKLSNYIEFAGPSISLELKCRDSEGIESLEFKTLILQELLKAGILISNGNSISLSYSHSEKDCRYIAGAFANTLDVYERALQKGVRPLLEGPAVKPVFRKFN